MDQRNLEAKVNQIQELCARLTERGVEYTQMTTVDGILFNVVTRDGHYFILVRDNGTGIEMWSRDLTPEQAIAATLGPGTCKPVAYDNVPHETHVEPGDYYEFWEPACACSECGELIPMRNFCPNCGRRLEVDE